MRQRSCTGFLYKVVLKIGHLRKFNRSREIDFNFLTAWRISMKFGTLFQQAPGYKSTPQSFLFYAQGLSLYNMVIQIRKNGVKSLPNFERS